MKRIVSAVIGSCLVVLATAAPLVAQTGTIAGVVTAAGSNQPLAEAIITAQSATGRDMTTHSAQNGRYILRNVAPGTYTVSVSALGFGSMDRQVQLTAGGTATADFALEADNTRIYELNPVVVTGTLQPEKATAAPSRVDVVGEIQIDVRPAVTPVDHLRSMSAVDIVQYGVQSTSVVVRGFNNVFSGALHTLTDYRLAGVPSLRVNLMHFVPATNEDLQRMEVVLGPASALYGPNTADGVLHLITKSPLLEQGSSVSITGGERDLLHATFRSAHLLGERLGIKLSGQYLQADEWVLEDTVELTTRVLHASDPDFWRADLARAAGISETEAALWMSRVGLRDLDIKRYAGELRADWRVTDRLGTVFTVGSTWVENGIEQTGLGAAQARDWRYSFFQARANWDRLFAQAYLNASDAGDTYLLRTGQPIVDRSKLWAGQLQHGFGLGERQDFTYGMDLFYTQPETEGTINGIYEDEDETTEFGAYLQSRTDLTDRIDLVLAGRIDTHSALPDAIFSPRAALVYQPSEDQSFRATFNRAFSTPTSINQFLDLGTAIPIAAAARLGYSVRVQGTGDTGFRFRQSDGSFLMRSPFTPGAGGPAMLVPAAAALYWQAAVNVLAAARAAAGQPLDPQIVGFLQSLSPTPADIASNFNVPGQTTSAPLEQLNLPDIQPIRESTSTTLEVGYRGVLAESISLAADVWYSVRQNFVTPLTTFTPFVALRGQDVAAYLVPRLMGIGMSQAEAQATAALLAGGLAQVPLGVISSADVNATGAQLLASYTNVDDEFDLYGVDVSATARMGGGFRLGAAVSLVNDHSFETDDGLLVTLNAAKTKGTLTLGYDAPATLGLSSELRARYNDEYPVLSGVYRGAACIDGGATDPCVDSFTLLDLTLGYSPPTLPGVAVQLSVQNLLDEEYRSYPGMPEIGRLAMLRLRYEFGPNR